MNQMVEQKLAALDKRPPVFVSGSPEHGRIVRRTAVAWVKIVPNPQLVGRDAVLRFWLSFPRRQLEFVSWDAAARGTGLAVEMIAATVKAVWTQCPNAVDFAIDRMGNNVGFRIRDAAGFAAAQTADQTRFCRPPRQDGGLRG